MWAGSCGNDNCANLFQSVITKIVSWISDNCSGPLFLLIIGFILEQKEHCLKEKVRWGWRCVVSPVNI